MTSMGLRELIVDNQVLSEENDYLIKKVLKQKSLVDEDIRPLIESREESRRAYFQGFVTELSKLTLEDSRGRNLSPFISVDTSLGGDNTVEVVERRNRLLKSINSCLITHFLLQDQLIKAFFPTERL